VEPISFSFIALLALCVAYIVAYSRVGVTHPTSIFFSFVAVFLPLKYLLIKLGDLNYASFPDMVGALSQSGAVEQAGLLLFIYLLLSALLHQCFRALRFPVPLVSVEVRFPMAAPSIVIALLWVAVFIIVESVDSLFDGLKLRQFTQTRGMSYVSIVYDLVVLVALMQALDARRYMLLSVLIIFHGSFGVLSGRTGPIVTIALFILVYLLMVRRQVPLKALYSLALVMPGFALLHGILRVRGDLLSSFDYLGEILSGDVDLFQIFATAVVERISELEDFSVLSSAILSGKLATDPFWPMQLLLQFVPRSIWEDKPFFFGPEIMSIFYPDVLEAGVNFAFLGIGEFIYAFDLPGIVAAAVLTAFLLHVGDKYVRASKGNSGTFLFFFLVPYFYLLAGFIGGWINSVVLPTILIDLLVLNVIGSIKILRPNHRASIAPSALWNSKSAEQGIPR